MRRFITICVLCLALMGCNPSILEQQSETLSQGVYGAATAIDSGRIDQADSLTHSLQTFVSPPKKALVENPIIDPKTGVADVILPTRLNGKVIVVGSADYQELLKDKTLAEELNQSNKQLTDFQAASQKQKIEDQKVLNAVLKQLNDYKQSIFFKAYEFWHTLTWFVPTIFGLSVITIIVVCVFCPPLVAPIMTFLGTCVGAIVSVLKKIVQSIIN